MLPATGLSEVIPKSLYFYLTKQSLSSNLHIYNKITLAPQINEK